jgi:gliding motility-associated-like protein
MEQDIVSGNNSNSGLISLNCKKEILFKKLCIVFILFIAGTLKLSAQNGGSSPLQFVENKGQWDPEISYRAQMRNGAFFLHKNGFSVLMQDENDLQKIHLTHHGITTNSSQKNAVLKNADSSKMVLHSHMYRVSFRNANENTELIPEKPIETYNNYFIGSDSSKWATHCRIFQAMTYKNIYPNIDLNYYAENGSLKYNIIVHPGGNPDNIALRYDGVDQLVAKNKQLQIKTSLGVLKETIPLSYQLSSTAKTDVECKYVLADKNTIKFKIKNYSPDATLVIDPTEIFCSFSGSVADNWGFTATYGPDGSMFIAGIVSGSGYKITTGAFQKSFAGGGAGGANSEAWDIGIMKFNPTGSTVMYATYLGGGSNDYPHSLICDPQGELIVFGRTASGLTFPLQPANDVAGKGGGRDIFVTKFNASGTALIGSMLIGGSGDDGVNIQDQDECSSCIGLNSLVRNYGDWSRGEVILDGGGNIYVASCTQSKTDFPIVGSVFQPKFGGGNQDGVIIKINPSCNSLIFSSYLGGTHDDVAFVMDLDPLTNDIFVGGSTVSPDFPGIKASVLQSVKSDSIDGFVSRIANNGSAIIASTFIGTTGIDMVYGLKFDKFGYPYVMGTTTGSWKVTPNVSWSNAGAKQFVSKLDTNLSRIIYSTTFGSVNASRPNISPVAFLVDQCQNVYVSGWGGFYRESEPYFLQGTLGMQVTTPAINGLKTVTDNHDFYFIVIKRDASGLLFGNFFGQDDTKHSDPTEWCCSEHVDGGTSRFDKQGTIYEAICANCVDHAVTFPTSAGARYRINGATEGAGCNEAALKIAFNFAGVSAGLKSLINGRPDTSGCIILIPTLEDTVLNARSYIWSFGDGSPDLATTSSQVTHEYDNVGTYLVRLIAIDSTSCNIADTAYTHIRARNDPASVAFEDLKLPPCQSLSYQFNNLSSPPPGKSFSNSSFIWDFGDGTTITTGMANQTHTFTAAGSYKVRLILNDTNYCNSPDTVLKVLNVSPLVKAQFIVPATGCAPDSVIFNNTSAGGQQFYWNFGDGTTSTDPSPGHLYPNVGSYTIKLVVVDSNTCNIIDSTQTTINIYSKPHAGLSVSPVTPIANTPNVFTNLSTGGVLYKWFFGDGDTAIRTTTDTVIHQYNSTGTFQACVVVYNQYQCTDTACIAVQTIINPLLDVPNAFTPGRFGENAIVKVRGFGISKLTFRIYSRWGQKVFESNDVNVGWDGNYKGNPQPMDVYAYTVEAEYFDGTKAAKKGDITLIR